MNHLVGWCWLFGCLVLVVRWAWSGLVGLVGRLAGSSVGWVLAEGDLTNQKIVVPTVWLGWLSAGMAEMFIAHGAT